MTYKSFNKPPAKVHRESFNRSERHIDATKVNWELFKLSGQHRLLRRLLCMYHPTALPLLDDIISATRKAIEKSRKFPPTTKSIDKKLKEAAKLEKHKRELLENQKLG